MKIIYFISTLALAVLLGAGSTVQAQKKSSCVDLSFNTRLRSTDAKTDGEVTLLQDFLQDKGYLKTSPTGYFGVSTRNAVTKFQKEYNVGDRPYGYVGPKTRVKIKELDCEMVDTTSYYVPNTYSSRNYPFSFEVPSFVEIVDNSTGNKADPLYFTSISGEKNHARVTISDGPNVDLKMVMILNTKKQKIGNKDVVVTYYENNYESYDFRHGDISYMFILIPTSAANGGTESVRQSIIKIIETLKAEKTNTVSVTNVQKEFIELSNGKTIKIDSFYFKKIQTDVGVFVEVSTHTWTRFVDAKISPDGKWVAVSLTDGTHGYAFLYRISDEHVSSIGFQYGGGITIKKWWADSSGVIMSITTPKPETYDKVRVIDSDPTYPRIILK